jgi:hypothetical protein
MGKGQYPLEGLKVVDFGCFVGGPYATTLLAQLGADVIKVEPKTGDRMRLDDLIFVGTQRGKRSLAMDLKAQESRDVLERLIRWADVVHSNLRPAALAKLGLDYESVRAINPAVVYCNVTGFGASGRRSGMPVFDPEMQALAGWSSMRTDDNGRPRMVRCAPTDIHAAMYSLVPTLAAVFNRERSGRGALVETSVLAAALLISAIGSLTWPRRTSRRCAGGEAAITVQPGAAASGGYGALAFDPGRAAPVERASAHLGRTEHCQQPCPRRSRCRAGGRGYGAPVLPRSINERLQLVSRHPHPLYGNVGAIGALWDLGDLEPRLDRPPPPGLTPELSFSNSACRTRDPSAGRLWGHCRRALI